MLTKPLFSQGDIVHIREDLEDGYDHMIDSGRSIGVAPPMRQYAGFIAAIEDVATTPDNEPVGYRLDVDYGDWVWADEMFDEAQVLFQYLKPEAMPR